MSTRNAVPVDSSSSEGKVVDYLAKHPRMIGVLFTILLLLTQVGEVAAGSNATTAGP